MTMAVILELKGPRRRVHVRLAVTASSTPAKRVRQVLGGGARARLATREVRSKEPFGAQGPAGALMVVDLGLLDVCELGFGDGEGMWGSFCVGIRMLGLRRGTAGNNGLTALDSRCCC
jgi:hypothetical protein